MSAGRPSLGSVLGGRQALAGQAAQNVMERAADVLHTVKQNEELKGATAVIRAATGGGSEVQMDPVKAAIEALRAGAELATDRETKQQQAQAQTATARVEEMRVKQEGDLGAANMLLNVLDRMQTKGDGAGSLDTLVRLMELMRPQQSGMNFEGLAALISALAPIVTPMLERAPRDGNSANLQQELNHRFELLQQELKHLAESKGGGGLDMSGMLAGLKQLQELTGTAPGHQIENRRLDMQERLATHEISEKEQTRRAEYESHGQFVSALENLATSYMSGDARKDQGASGNGWNQEAPRSQAARGVSIKCGNCQKLIPIQGEPPASLTCPHCGAKIERGAA